MSRGKSISATVPLARRRPSGWTVDVFLTFLGKAGVAVRHIDMTGSPIWVRVADRDGGNRYYEIAHQRLRQGAHQIVIDATGKELHGTHGQTARQPAGTRA